MLDLGLPDMDGKQALEKARAFYEGPILILSARDMEMEKIQALDPGRRRLCGKTVPRRRTAGSLKGRHAPQARPRGRGSRSSRPATSSIDLIKRLVTRAGEMVHLSPREYDLLASSWPKACARPGADPSPAADRRLGPGQLQRRAVSARLHRPSPARSWRPTPPRRVASLRKLEWGTGSWGTRPAEAASGNKQHGAECGRHEANDTGRE